jgi:hypothetical protein
MKSKPKPAATRKESSKAKKSARRSDAIDFDNLFDAAALELSAAWTRSKDQVRPDEVGGPRERRFRDFLGDWLPRRYGVTHGYVLNGRGERSDQMDCIIVDALDCPLFFQDKTEDRRLVPIDYAFGAMEVKSTLDANELTDSISKLTSFGSLVEKVPRHRFEKHDEMEVSLQDVQDGPWVKRRVRIPANGPTWPFGIIVAYKLKNISLEDAADCCAEHPFPPEMIVSLKDGIALRNSLSVYERLRTLEGRDRSGGDFVERIAATMETAAGRTKYRILASSEGAYTLTVFYCVLMDLLNSAKLAPSLTSGGDVIARWRQKRRLTADNE